MTRSSLAIGALVVVGLAGLSLCGGAGLFVYKATGINDSGSPPLAEEWRTILEPIEGPEEAKRKHPEIEVIRFRDGGWVIGFSRNSHGLWEEGGGTLVVKDSRGATRVFFGHVCGPRMLENGCSGYPSLDEFCKALPNRGLVEQELR